MTLLPTCWRENWREIQNLSGVLFGNERCNLPVFIILRLLWCGAYCTTHLLTHPHECLLLHLASVVGLCLIYNLGELTGQRFQAKLLLPSHWQFTEFWAETPPCLWDSSPRNPPSPLEFKFHGMVWICSGITHYSNALISGHPGDWPRGTPRLLHQDICKFHLTRVNILPQKSYHCSSPREHNLKGLPDRNVICGINF